MESPNDLIFLGDSLSTDFYVSKTFATVIRARAVSRKASDGWPQRLPCRVKTYASVSGYVNPCPPSIRFQSKFFLGAQSLRAQIHRVLKDNAQHPRLYFSWVGHNNLDWWADTKLLGCDSKDHIVNQPKVWAKTILQDHLLLAERMPRSEKKVNLVVSGLVNFQDFFRLRNERMQSNPPPYAEYGNQIFPSMRLENQEKMIAMALHFNDALKKQVEIHAALFEEKNFCIHYSDSLSKIPLKNLRLLNESDAWHLSEFGMDYFASYMSDEIKNFL